MIFRVGDKVTFHRGLPLGSERRVVAVNNILGVFKVEGSVEWWHQEVATIAMTSSQLEARLAQNLERAQEVRRDIRYAGGDAHTLPEVRVYSAVIVQPFTGRILLTQRRPDQDFPYEWECPGGKMEPGESFLETLQREALEEVGARVVMASTCIWCGDFESPVTREDRKRVHVSFHPVTLHKDSMIEAREKQGMGWFSLMEVGWIDLAPAPRAAIKELMEHMRAMRETVDEAFDALKDVPPMKWEDYRTGYKVPG